VPEQSLVAECGWIAPEATEGLVELIESVGRGDLDEKRNGVVRACGNLSWDNEAVVLQQLYSEVRGDRPIDEFDMENT